jgi:uncharacterized repeat protein (TIGR02543 family)
MRFSRKLTSFIATLGLVLAGVTSGEVAANATASIYQPNAGASYTAYSQDANISASIASSGGSDGSISATFTVGQSTTIYSMLLQATIASGSSATYADNAPHTFGTSVTLTGPSNTSVPVTASPNVSTTQSAGYIIPVGNQITIPTGNSGIRVSENINSSGLSQGIVLAPGTYTVQTTFTRDSQVIRASDYASAALTFTAVSGGPSIVETGFQSQTNATNAVCLDTAQVHVGDHLVSHVIFDGADWAASGAQAILSQTWSYKDSASSLHPYPASSYVATSDMLLYATQITTNARLDSAANQTGTHTLVVSVTDTELGNLEISKTCAAAAPSLAPTMTLSMGAAPTVTLPVMGSMMNSVQSIVELLDAQGNVLQEQTAYSSGYANQVSFDAGLVTPGSSYTAKYKTVVSLLYSYGPSSDWSPSAPLTVQPAVVAPTVTQSGSTITTSITGLSYPLMMNSVLFKAYAASDTSTAVASFTGNCLSGCSSLNSNNTYTGNTSGGSPLQWGVPYKFTWCLATMNIQLMAYSCSAAESPLSISYTFTAPPYGYSAAPSNGTTLGSAVSDNNTVSLGNYASAGSDGSDGRLLASASGSTITIRHVTPRGADSTFGGAGTVSITTPNPVMMLNGVSYAGNRNKWAVAWMESTAASRYAIGSFSSSTPSVSALITTSPSNSSDVAVACAAAFSGSTSGMLSSGLPLAAATGELFVLASCSIPTTFSDSSTGTATAPVVMKITGDHAITVVGKIFTPSASVTNALSPTGSGNLSYSAYPGASGTDIQLAIPFISFARATATSSIANVPSAELQIAELRADGSFSIVDTHTTISVSSGVPNPSVPFHSQNDGTTLTGIATDTSGSSPVLSLERINLSTGVPALTQLTLDAAPSGFTGSNLILFPTGRAPAASGDFWAFRTGSGSTPKIAAVKISSSGVVTTYEAPALTQTTASSTYNWTVLSLNSSNEPQLFYSASQSTASSLHWRIADVPQSSASYTLSFNSNLAQGQQLTGSLPSSVVSSSSWSVPANPGISSTGYSFDGWFTQAVGGVQKANGSSLTLTGDQVLYAHWTQNPVNYTLSFNSNLAQGQQLTGSLPSSVVSSSSWSVPANPGISSTGYSFDGWFTQAVGGVQKANGSSLTLTGDQVLYAHWTQNPVNYTLSFDLNAPSGLLGSIVGSTPSNVVSTSTWTTPSNPGLTLSGYTFAGWNTLTAGGTHYGNGATVSLTGDLVLYAQWNADDAVPCAAGTYSLHYGQSSVNHSWTCTQASLGHYVTNSGSSSEQSCNPGYFAASLGSISCDPAPAGSYVALAAASAAVQCPSGSYSAQTGSTSCSLAQPGYFVAVAGASAQVACAAGYTSNAGALVCTLIPPVVAPALTVKPLPAGGLRSEGGHVQLEGSGLDSVANVTIGGKPAASVSSASGQLVLTSPANLAPGSYDVVLNLPGGGSYTIVGGYVVPAPIVEPVNPVTKPVVVPLPPVTRTTEVPVFAGNKVSAAGVASVVDAVLAVTTPATIVLTAFASKNGGATALKIATAKANAVAKALKGAAANATVTVKVITTKYASRVGNVKISVTG